MNIYVGNLAYSVTEDDLREAFSAYGEVSRANVIMDRDTGRSKGFGFVEMPDNSQAEAAINGLNDTATIGGDTTGAMTEDEAGASGALTVGDADDGEAVFQAQTGTVGNHGNFSVDAAGNWTYTRTADLDSMNDGDVLTD